MALCDECSRKREDEREKAGPFVYIKAFGYAFGCRGAADERNQGEHSALPFEYELLLPTICNNPILLVITQSKMLVLLV